MQAIKTYPEMNKQIKDLLMLSDEHAHQYAAKRIVELEGEVEWLKAENVRAVALAGNGYEELLETLRAVEQVLAPMPMMNNQRLWGVYTSVVDTLKKFEQD